MSRDVVLAVREQLVTNADPAPVYSYVDPGQTGDYVWLDESTTITPGPAREGNEATFSVYYRARGKAACEALARSGDFINDLTISEYGEAVWLRYSLDSRVGPTEDPDIPGQMQIVDTLTAKFWYTPRMAKA